MSDTVHIYGVLLLNIPQTGSTKLSFIIIVILRLMGKKKYCSLHMYVCSDRKSPTTV